MIQRLRRLLASLALAQGRTIVEVLVASAVAIIVIGGISNAQVNALRWYQADVRRLEPLQPMRDAADIIARDVRAAVKPPWESGGDLFVPVTHERDDPWTFVARYHLAGTDLQRIVGGTTRVIARNVVQFAPTASGGVVTIQMAAEADALPGGAPFRQELTLELLAHGNRG